MSVTSTEKTRRVIMFALLGVAVAVVLAVGYMVLFAPKKPPASVTLASARTDSVKGQMVFRGKTGKHIEERKDKTGKPYLMFSAFSTEKVNDGFEYQWVRFFCFGKEKEEWLQPGVKVDVKGEMYLSLYDGKPDISCRVEELNQYVPEAGNDNR